MTWTSWRGDGAMLKELRTEQPNHATENLDASSTLDVVTLMNEAEKTVAVAVEQVLPAVAEAVNQTVSRLERGGRLIYVGAGTSGRLGFLDAAECPPTFNTPPELVQSVIAGGQHALFEAVENAEDDEEAGCVALQEKGLSDKDVVVGIAASGRTPFVLGALQYAKTAGALTVGITCNRGSEIGQSVDVAIEIETGPEVLMGSTRLKAGTAQKMVLNMLSTATMVQLGKVYKNLMVDLKATNFKLKERSKQIIMLATGVSYEVAARVLDEAQGHVKAAILMLERGVSSDEAKRLLERSGGYLRKALAMGGEAK